MIEANHFRFQYWVPALSTHLYKHEMTSALRVEVSDDEMFGLGLSYMHAIDKQRGEGGTETWRVVT